MRQFFLILILLSLSGVVVAESRPNVLFIVSEDNSEHLGCYGETRVNTPALDGLAATGIRYTNAYVPYSVCSPSRSIFLTGMYTRQTGHIGLATHNFAMYKKFKTMPAYFQEAGYYTGFLGKTHINPESAVEDFIDHRAIREANFSKTISIERYAEEARFVMESAAKEDKPFLLIINYADAHRKFIGVTKNGFPVNDLTDPVPPFSWIGSDTPYLREEIRDYFNCINRLDEAVDMVLEDMEELKVRDNTIIVYISDHGADFPRAKGSCYEHGTSIPMIVNYPKRFPKADVEPALVSTIDILPTLLKEVGIDTPSNLPGQNLQDLYSGKKQDRDYIHTFTTGSSPNLLYMQFAIRDKRFKLIYSPKRDINKLAVSRYRNSKLPKDQEVANFITPPEYELFDLKRDPDEWNNLADNKKYSKVKERLLDAMHSFQSEIKDPFLYPDSVDVFVTEQKNHAERSSYSYEGFRWPHLKMFEKD